MGVPYRTTIATTCDSDHYNPRRWRKGYLLSPEGEGLEARGLLTLNTIMPTLNPEIIIGHSKHDIHDIRCATH
jgi:hypothetical protein